MGHPEDVARFGIRISDDLLAAARAEAKRQGEPVSAIMKQALVHYLAWIEGQRAASRGEDEPDDSTARQA